MSKMYRLSNIDKALNFIEFYLRGRLRSTDKLSQLQKKVADKRGHIVYSSCGEETWYKYTTSCYTPKPTAENPVEIKPELAEDGLLYPSPFIKVPRGKAIIDKNWGSCDYIVAQFKIDDNRSHMYYIDRIKFFEYIERGISTFEDFLDWDVGIPVNTLIKEGIITDVDLAYWAEQKYVGIIHNDNRFPTDGYFINRWVSGDRVNNNTPFFHKYPLSFHKNQSKKVRFITESGKSIEFASIKEASARLKIDRTCIYRLKTKKITKFYIHEGEKEAAIVKVEEVK